MGKLIRGILKTGAVAGAAVAGTKVAQRVKENNPSGVPDVNGDGKVDYKDTLLETKRAAEELFTETRERFEENNPEWKEKAANATQKAGDILQDVGEKAEEAVKTVVQKLDDLF